MGGSQPPTGGLIDTDDTEASAMTSGFTVQVPLGIGAQASVFLVRESRRGGRLLRLKRWQAAVDNGFLLRFAALRDRLAGWRHGGVARPLAAWLDEEGRPAVLSEFVQGIPIMRAVSSGELTGAKALDLIRPVGETLRTAHAEGLAHGSVVGGNIVVQPRTGEAYLLDFGMAAVCSPASGHVASVASDRQHMAALLRTIRRRSDWADEARCPA
jgi:serine/threonine-protein kinase